MNDTDSNPASPQLLDMETRRHCASPLGAVRASVADMICMVCPRCVTAQWHSMLGSSRIGRRPEIVLAAVVAAVSVAPLWVALAATTAIVGVISASLVVITTVGRLLGLGYDMAMGTLAPLPRPHGVPPPAVTPPDGDPVPKDAEPITDPHLGASNKVPVGEEAPTQKQRPITNASRSVRRQAVLMVHAAVKRGDTKVAAYAAASERVGYAPSSIERWVKDNPEWGTSPERIQSYPPEFRARAAHAVLTGIAGGETRANAVGRVAEDCGVGYSTVSRWVTAAGRAAGSQPA